ASRAGRPAADLRARAARVRLLLLDVDGVLTDGRLWYGPEGETVKAFDVRDGHGLVMLRDHVEVGILSGRPAGPTQSRLADLRIRHASFGNREKLPAYQSLAASLGVADEEVAFMGDDVNDLPVLRRVGLSACPADAAPEVLREARLVSRARGGRGAVRELCELILKAKGLWNH
ncbi:MAG TPA: HAD hydrolase family protein, partial [Anaeromyxobacteraceae bacterium]|nr:HAD hydrolase family protein [Anaeromyxobacteraceae bacterium]